MTSRFPLARPRGERRWLEASQASFTELVQQRPRIDLFNCSLFEPPNLRKFMKQDSRGPDSAPAIWYKQMTGEEWDGEGTSYTKAKKIYDGLLGGNCKRMEQRRESEHQKRVHAEDFLARRARVRAAGCRPAAGGRGGRGERLASTEQHRLNLAVG